MHVAVGNTAIQFKALNRRVKAISFHARSTNTGQLYIGGSGVVSTNGYELTANQSVAYTFGNDGSDQLLDFYMNAATTDQTCDFMAVYE